MSRVNFTLSFDNEKDNDIKIINAVKKYSSNYYMSQNAAIKMILRIALIDMGFIDMNLSTAINNSLNLSSTESTPEENSHLNTLISNSLNSILK